MHRNLHRGCRRARAEPIPFRRKRNRPRSTSSGERMVRRNRVTDVDRRTTRVPSRNVSARSRLAISSRQARSSSAGGDAGSRSKACFEFCPAIASPSSWRRGNSHGNCKPSTLFLGFVIQNSQVVDVSSTANEHPRQERLAAKVFRFHSKSRFRASFCTPL